MDSPLSTLIGVALLLVAVSDVYQTILHARARSGVLSETINRMVWRAVRSIAFRLPRQRRHRLLNKIGPLLLPAFVILLIVILITGFALIYLSNMPASFNVDSEAESSPVVEAFYFSGITLMTVGYGDITPDTLSMRSVALLESASGFVLISLGVTYLITVYSALERKRAVALSFYHRADEGADAAGFIAHHFVDDRFYGLEDTLRAATRDIQDLLEAHIEHPIIHYFHPIEVHKGMPRILFLILETCVVIKSCLDQEKNGALTRHPEVNALDRSARYVLGTMTTSLDLNDNDSAMTNHVERAIDDDETPGEERRRWRARWRQTMERLEAEGIPVRSDRRQSWDDYQRQRREWESALYRFAVYLGYDWDEVTGDRDLEYASNEEMEDPATRTGLALTEQARAGEK